MEKKTTVISPEALQRQEGFCGRVREYWQAQGITPVAFVETYGCQQNEADSEQIRGMLEHCGYGLTDGPEGADLVIFNTCAIREHAEQRVFGNVGALVHTRRRHPRQKIFLCGCMMGQPAVVERVRKSYPYVDGVFSTHHLWELPQLLLGVLTTGKRVFSVEDSAGAMEDYAIGQAAVGGDESVPLLLEAVSAVTEERVRQAAACVRPDTIYFLKGKEA